MSDTLFDLGEAPFPFTYRMREDEPVYWLSNGCGYQIVGGGVFKVSALKEGWKVKEEVSVENEIGVKSIVIDDAMHVHQAENWAIVALATGYLAIANPTSIKLLKGARIQK